MAMTSVSSRAQMLPVAAPATAVRPARRVVQVVAKQEMSQRLVARTGMAAAAAVALLVVCSKMAWSACMTEQVKVIQHSFSLWLPALWTHNRGKVDGRMSYSAGHSSVRSDFRTTGAQTRLELKFTVTCLLSGNEVQA